MPKDIKQSTNVEGNLDNHTYPTSIDSMMRPDKDFEGSESSLPPAGTNPLMGADGTLPSRKISKVK